MEIKRIKLAIMDMDGTVVRYNSGSFQSSWDALGEAAGLKEEWDRLVGHYLPQCIQRPDLYAEWFDRNVAGLQGLVVQPLLEKLFPIPYAPGFMEFARYWKGQGTILGLLTSGVDLVARRIQEEAGLDFAVANEVQVEAGKFTGKGKINVGFMDKGKLVRELLQKYHATKEEAAYFGDHLNDEPAWKEVGLPIGIHLKTIAAVDYRFDDFLEALESLAGKKVDR